MHIYEGHVSAPRLKSASSSRTDMVATQEGGNAKCVLGIEVSGAPGWPRPLLVVINQTSPPALRCHQPSLTHSFQELFRAG